MCWFFRIPIGCFANFSVKFDDQNFSDTCYDEGHWEGSILKNTNPSQGFYVQCLELGVIGPHLRAIRQIFRPYKLVSGEGRESRHVSLKTKHCRETGNRMSIRPLLRMASTKTLFSYSIVHSFISLHMYNANLHGFFAALIFMHSRADIAPANDPEKYRSRRLEISSEKICHPRDVFVLNRDLK